MLFDTLLLPKLLVNTLYVEIVLLLTKLSDLVPVCNIIL